MRVYSSNPSLRCAFCIFLSFRLRRRLGQLQGPSIGIDQSEFVRPPFAMMDNLLVAILFDECGHVLDRSPPRDVPVIALAEEAIQKARRTQQTNMATVQRRDWTPSSHILTRHQKRERLLPCG